MALACAEGTVQRFFSLSARIQRERKQYCDQLEATEHGTLGVTPWLDWFLACLLRAMQGATDCWRTACSPCIEFMFVARMCYYFLSIRSAYHVHHHHPH